MEKFDERYLIKRPILTLAGRETDYLSTEISLKMAERSEMQFSIKNYENIRISFSFFFVFF